MILFIEILLLMLPKLFILFNTFNWFILLMYSFVFIFSESLLIFNQGLPKLPSTKLLLSLLFNWLLLTSSLLILFSSLFILLFILIKLLEYSSLLSFIGISILKSILSFSPVAPWYTKLFCELTLLYEGVAWLDFLEILFVGKLLFIPELTILELWLSGDIKKL